MTCSTASMDAARRPGFFLGVKYLAADVGVEPDQVGDGGVTRGSFNWQVTSSEHL